jgi:hypothetical protein
MSADLLRRAAAKLREHANAASEGPWEADGVDIWAGTASDVWAGEADERANASYAALMHPPVALALADWLDATAERIEILKPVVGHEIYGVGHPQEFIERTYAKSLAVARAVLREDGEQR